MPVISVASSSSASNEITWLGGKLRNVSGLGDRSAYGLPDKRGVIVDEISAGSVLAKSPLKRGDVIREMNDKKVDSISDLSAIYQEINWTGRSTVEIYRNQKLMTVEISFK